MPVDALAPFTCAVACAWHLLRQASGPKIRSIRSKTCPPIRSVVPSTKVELEDFEMTSAAGRSRTGPSAESRREGSGRSGRSRREERVGGSGRQGKGKQGQRHINQEQSSHCLRSDRIVLRLCEREGPSGARGRGQQVTPGGTPRARGKQAGQSTGQRWFVRA